MNYVDALNEWGALKLEKRHQGRKKSPLVIDRSTIFVEMCLDAGYDCCDSSSASIEIIGWGTMGNKKPQQYTTSIGHYEFDFTTILREIVEASGGSVTNE